MDRAHNLFFTLSGHWQVERTITPGGIFTGTAVFQKTDDGDLLYREQGALTLESGEVLEPFKAYLYRLEEGQVHVYFADGETSGALFHVLDFMSDTQAQAEHLCGQDMYKTTYDFELPDRFTITHIVHGPEKEYVSKSVLTRT